MIVLLVRTDGRKECIASTLRSFEEMVSGTITRRIIHDDSGDPKYRLWLRETFPAYQIVSTRRRSGFGGAIRSAWKHLETVGEAWVADWEDDFVVTRPVDLDDLVQLQVEQPHLAQVCLRRQAVGHEIRHGGFMEMAPEWYRERRKDGWAWVETTRNWTTNPSVYRHAVCATGWPEGRDSEGHFGFRLKDEGLPWGVPGRDVRFGFWGSMEEGREWIWHIGDQRAGTGY